MKRHLNSLLQRQRADFDSTHSARPNSQFTQDSADTAHVVVVKDGYDWLQHIQRYGLKNRDVGKRVL